MPGDLDRGQVEKRLVLFGLWEFINGPRPARQNRLAKEIAGSVGPLELRQLAARHGLRVPPHRKIAGTAGSDDHGGIFGGATYTVARKSGARRSFWRRCLLAKFARRGRKVRSSSLPTLVSGSLARRSRKERATGGRVLCGVSWR
jgi:hypothetical protein